jgi:hypothetical protein
VDSKVAQHLQVAFGLLKEGQSPQAFGELVHATRTLPMTRRLAAALVALSLKAGTEAVAVTVLANAARKVRGEARREVQRQLARVLRRSDQLPRAIETLEGLLVAFPQDLAARRVLQVLLERTGRWEALATWLESEAQEAVRLGQFGRAARAARWRARVQAEQLRNMSRAAESYSQVANYLERMGDADGAFAVRLDGLRALHSSGASESVLTAAASVCMSAAARLGRDDQARHVLEELGLIPAMDEAPPMPEATEPEERPYAPEPRSAEPEPQRPEPEPQRPAPKPQRPAPEPQRAEPERRLAERERRLASPEPRRTEPELRLAEPKTRPAEPVPEPAAPETPAARTKTEEFEIEAGTAEPTAQPAEAEARPVVPEAAPAEPPAEAGDPVPPVELYLPRLLAVLDAASSGQAEGALSAPAPAGEGAAQDKAAEAGSQAAPKKVEEDNAGQAPKPEEPPPASVELWNDPTALQRLEAQLIARKSWQELAQFYLMRADRAKDPSLRAEALTRLAELLENELGDPSGAARIYREIVKQTGDRDALKEQLRLIAQRGEPALVRRALDEAVQLARTPKARAAAYLTRAERELAAGETAQAKADFETAEALTPGMLLVLAGLVRCVSDAERPAVAQRLRAALTAAPRRSPDRLDALRTLATIAEDSLKDAKLAQWAWAEVLAEDPAESHARQRLLELTRALGDKAALSQLLREQLAREPRGTAARQARMELVAALEESGDADGALNELRQAVRFEPGHKEAWLLLADRLNEHGQIGEAAWAMEHAATATEDEAERQRAWVRLASFCYNVLKDPARGEMYSRRAENLRQALLEKSAPPVPEAPRSEAARREGGTRTRVLIPSPANVNLTPAGQPLLRAEVPPESEITDPGTSIPAHARKTQEVRVSEIFGKAPFAEEEPTASGAPDGGASAKSEKAAKPPEKAAKPPASPIKNLGRKITIEPMDPSRELDSLLGSESEDGHTSPSLSAWNLKRPPGLAAKPQKAIAPVPPPVPSPAPTGKKPTLEQPAGQRKRTRTRTDEVPQAFVPDTPVPPSRSALPHLEDTSPGRRSGPKPFPEAASSAKAPRGSPRKEDSAEAALAKVSPREPESPPSRNKQSVQNTSFISWEAPPGKMDPVRRVARPREGTSSRQGLPQEPHGAEPPVFKQVRENPLEAPFYEEIAEFFRQRGDTQRADLMQEIADALDGKEGPPPRLQRQPLSAEHRSGLRHPLLRSPAGELLTCVGVALCRLFPMHGRAAGTQERLRPSLGPGAPASIEAFEASQRLLGIEAPEVVLSEDNGPPFSLVFTSAPRLLVGKQAIRQVLPGPELRFYAGRALLCLSPDLLALRSLKKDQILRGMALLSSVLKDKNASGLEARVMRESLTPQQIDQAAALFGPATREFNVSALADAARDSSNRAGLITCGSVGPAISALRMKRALEREIVELVRFAASERYFQLRYGG